MPKLEVLENKILRLVNVLSRNVPTKDILGNGKQVAMLQNWIKAKGYKSVGPLIIYSSGIKGTTSSGTPIIDTGLLLQLKEDMVKVEYPYKFESLVRVENCLYVRYDDLTDRVQLASAELQLYAYKNDIELTGVSYTVVVNETNEKLTADIFMPIKVLESEES